MSGLTELSQTELPRTEHTQTQQINAFAITCEVCEEVVKASFGRSRFSQSSEPIVCNSLSCRQIVAQRDHQSPFFYQRLVEAQRQFKQAQRELTAREIRRIELLNERTAEENKKVRRLANSQLPQLNPDTRLISIPSGLTKLISLPKERIEKYKTKLSEEIAKAAEFSNLMKISDSEEIEAREKSLRIERMLDGNSKLRIVSDQMCGICKGGCCSSGNDHAYLTVSTIRRFMDDNPTLSPDEVLKSYVDKLATETVEDSCINQTKIGCGLPREMRSDSCNAYYCQEIKSFHLEVSESESELASEDLIAVQRAHTHWDRQDEFVSHDVTSVSVLSDGKIIPVKTAEL